MTASGLSRDDWVLAHAKGSVALAAGLPDLALAVALAGEGVSVVFAGSPETIAHAPALLAEEPAAVQRRIEVRETDASLDGFAARQFDLAVLDGSMFTAGAPSAAAACARIVDAGALVLFLPPDGASGSGEPRSETVVALVDAFHQEFEIDRLDLVDSGLGVIARRRFPGEAAVADHAVTFGSIVLALVRRVGTEERLNADLRAGLASRDQAFAALEAELDAALPRGGAWADDDVEDAAPPAADAAEPAEPAAVPMPESDAVLLAALDDMDEALREAELRPGRPRLETSLAELEAALASISPRFEGQP